MAGARMVENCDRSPVERVQIPAVEPHRLNFCTRFAKPRRDRGRIFDAAHRIVSIDEQSAQGREAAYKIAERVALAVMRHHEAVTHGAENWNPVTLSREHIRRAIKASQMAH